MLTFVYASVIALLFGLVPQTPNPAIPAYACSPDGGQVTFSTNRLNLLDTATGEMHIVLENGDLIDGFAWSPDGRRVAMELLHGESWGVYVLEVSEDGEAVGEPQALVDLPDVDEANPAWSPDGTKIAFYAGSNVYVANADGSDAQALDLPHRATGNLLWTPDSARLLYAVFDDNTPWVIESANVQTGETLELARGDAGYVALADMSAQGIALLVVYDPEDGPALFSLDSASGDMTNFDMQGDVPDFAPDGTRFAFGPYQFDNYTGEIVIMPLSASFSRVLTGGFAPGVVGSFDWSPDGTHIVFTAFRPDYTLNSRVHVLNVRTLEVKVFDEAYLSDTGAVWRPCAAS